MRARLLSSMSVATLLFGSIAVAGCGTSTLFDEGTGASGAATGSGGQGGAGQGGVGQGGVGQGGVGQGGSAGGVPETCGDGILNPGEDCDGMDLGGASCLDAGYGTPGAIGCSDDCSFDTSGCMATCDGTLLEPGESCDGADLGANSCTDFGFSNPAGLTCTPRCMPDPAGCSATCDGALLESGEECDGAFLNNTDCTAFGYVDPMGLSCDGCSFDASTCNAVCGNGVQEPGEACDDGNMDPNDACDNSCNTSGGTTCATGIPVALGPGTTTFTGSTTGGGQHSGGCQGDAQSPDRIYAVTPSQSGFLTAALVRANTTYDSLLYILTACQDPNSSLWCADSWANVNPQLTGGETTSAQVQAGQTYYVVVDGFGGEQGNYELTLDLSAGDCADPVPFPLWSGQNMSALGNTAGLGNNQNTALCGGSISPEVVYELQPQLTGAVDVRLPTGDTNYDSVLSARTTCTDISSQLDCEHDGGGLENFTVQATMGQPIYVLVDGWAGSSGEYRLRLGP